jgi:hypothetical protein
MPGSGRSHTLLLTGVTRSVCADLGGLIHLCGWSVRSDSSGIWAGGRSRRWRASVVLDDLASATTP